jgi:proton glutamate symport protein
MKKLALHWQILIALAVAFIIGITANYLAEGREDEPVWFDNLEYGTRFIGTLFLNALKMVVVPLVTTSIICGIINVGGDKDFGRLGRKTLMFYATSGFFAVVIGLICVNLIQPGEVEPELRAIMLAQESVGHQDKIAGALENASGGFRSVLEIFQRMIPSNLFVAAAEGQLLGLIFFSLLLGFFISKLPENHRESQTRFWESFNAAILAITKFIIGFAPLGVFGLVTPTLMTTGTELFGVMGKFAVTVLLGLAIHAFVILPLFLKFVAREKPLKHFYAMSPALLTAFSTASSSATLPLTMDCVRKRAGVSRKVSSFTLPLGATVNMDGTALFECVVVVFLAQLFGIEMGLVTQFSVVLMALLTSIGVAGIPGASLVAIIVILNAVGFPEASIATGIGIVYVVDRILDMTRTAINVFGDSCAAVVIGKTEGETDYYPENSTTQN